jgi:putative flippase GtrA
VIARLTTPAELVRFAKAQFSTGVATLLEWALILVLTRLGVWYVGSAIAGAVAGGVTDFAIKKWWVFRTHRAMPADSATSALALTGAEAIRYAAVSGASALLYGAAVYLLVDLLHWHLPVAVVGGSVLVGIFWNYPLHRFFVFSPATASTPVSGRSA